MTSVAETCWGPRLIDDKPYWHLVGAHSLFNHNVRVGKGAILSLSAGIASDPNIESAQTPYSFATLGDPKESLFETVRQQKFPTLPSRSKSLYVFDDYAFVERALIQWFANENKTVRECRVLTGSVLHKADTEWLNGAPAYWDQNSLRYWSGEMSTTPFPEVLVHGALYFPEWQSFGTT